MWQILSSIISGIIGPITTSITAIYTKKEDTILEKFKVDGQVDMQLVQAHIAIITAQAGLLKNQWLVALQVLFGVPLAFYYGKIHIWDAAFGWGSTAAIHGDVATWDMWIVSFLFLHSAVTTWGRKT